MLRLDVILGSHGAYSSSSIVRYSIKATGPIPSTIAENLDTHIYMFICTFSSKNLLNKFAVPQEGISGLWGWVSVDFGRQ